MRSSCVVRSEWIKRFIEAQDFLRRMIRLQARPLPPPPTVSGPATNSKAEKERQFGDGREGWGRGRTRSLLLYKHSILSGRDPFSLFLKIHVDILDTKIQIQIVDKNIVEMPVGRLKPWL